MNKTEHLSRVPWNSICKALWYSSPVKWIQVYGQKRSHSRDIKGCCEPLPFACSQHVVNPSLAQSASSQTDAFKQLFFMMMMTQAWYGTKTKFHGTALPSQRFPTRPSLAAFLARTQGGVYRLRAICSFLQKSLWAWRLSSPWDGSSCKEDTRGSNAIRATP